MQSNSYPSILKLKELEAKVKMLLSSYIDAQSAYEQSVSLNDKIDQKRWLNIINNVNNDLVSIISQIYNIIKNLERKGINYQKTETNDVKNLHKLSKKLNMRTMKISQSQKQLTNLDGEIETTNLSESSNYTHMIFLFVNSIVIVFFISKAAIKSETSPTENIILIVAIISLLYHLFAY